jgi:hypothetical protein
MINLLRRQHATEADVQTVSETKDVGKRGCRTALGHCAVARTADGDQTDAVSNGLSLAWHNPHGTTAVGTLDLGRRVLRCSLRD